jgi:hypothetical protein
MTTLALIDRSSPLRPSTTGDEAPVGVCVDGDLELEKRLDQAPRSGALEDARASGDGRGTEAHAVASGEPRHRLRSTGLRRKQAGIGETGYWIRTEGLE